MGRNKVKSLGLKIDLHVHTCYSYDAVTTLKEVVAYSKKRGLDGVAITDHDTLLGAFKLTQKTELIVIPGVEITALGGHVLALNVTKPIPPKLGLPETVQRIHEAGGIAVAAHPYSVYKSVMSQQIVSCDAVEVINSAAVPFSLSTYLNRKLATRLKLPQTAGSDAHYAPEIGSAYTIIEADPDVDEIVQAIKRGATFPLGKRIPWGVRLRRGALSLKRRIG
jgi:hypothetical protein